MPDSGAPLLLEQALSGRPESVRQLVDLLSPVVQARVARMLLRRRPPSGAPRDARQEIEDLCQEVFVALFAQDGRALRAWRPDGGLSLQNFVGLLAERQVSSILRSGRRSPWTEDPHEAEALEGLAEDSASPEPRLESRELLEALLDRLRESLSPRGLELFHRLVVRQEDVERVCAATGMTREAVYAWRSRLSKLVRKLASELENEVPPSDRVEPRRIPSRNGLP